MFFCKKIQILSLNNILHENVFPKQHSKGSWFSIKNISKKFEKKWSSKKRFFPAKLFISKKYFFQKKLFFNRKFKIFFQNMFFFKKKKKRVFCFQKKFKKRFFQKKFFLKKKFFQKRSNQMCFSKKKFSKKFQKLLGEDLGALGGTREHLGVLGAPGEFLGVIGGTCFSNNFFFKKLGKYFLAKLFLPKNIFFKGTKCLN
jgi:hypothetical protein